MNSIQKQSKDYELIAASWHEAAHTICGLYNFLYIIKVYVSSDKYEHGNTLYEMYDPSKFKNKLLIKILIIFEIQTLYAGLIGEKMYYKEICGSDKFPMHLRIGSSSDINSASSLINKYNLAESGKDRFLFKKQIQNDTRNILINYWEDVKLIAHFLYRNKELKYDELKYCLTRYSTNKDFWKVRFKEIKRIYDERLEIDEKYLKEILFQNYNLVV